MLFQAHPCVRAAQHRWVLSFKPDTPQPLGGGGGGWAPRGALYHRRPCTQGRRCLGSEKGHEALCLGAEGNEWTRRDDLV